MRTIIAIKPTPRMLPTTIGSSGTPAPLLARTCGRRPALPLPAPAEALARDLVAIRPLVEYRPDLSGLGRWRVAAVRRGLNPEEGGSLLREYEVLYIVRADVDDEKVQ